MKIAIFGGSFNPIHLGHLCAAKQVLEKAKLDQIWFTPAYRNPLKPTYGISEKHRIKMIKLAIDDIPNFRLSDFEVDQKILFTVESVRILKKKYPKHNFYWIIGSDLVPQLEKWDDIRHLIKEIRFVIVPVLGDNIGRIKKNKFVKINKSLILGGCLKTDLSSTEVREYIKSKKDFSNLVPKSVYEYIKKHRLYS